MYVVSSNQIVDPGVVILCFLVKRTRYKTGSRANILCNHIYMQSMYKTMYGSTVEVLNCTPYSENC